MHIARATYTKALSEIMILDFLFAIAVGLPLILLAVYVYVETLLFVARVSSGFMKVLLGLAVYAVAAVVLVAPLLGLLAIASPVLQASDWGIALPLAGYVLIIWPGIYYLSVVRIAELRRAGYFLPRP